MIKSNAVSSEEVVSKVSGNIRSEKSDLEGKSQKTQPQVATRSRISQWLTRLGLIAFGLIISLLLFEAAFRRLAPTLTPKRWRDLPKKYYLPESSGSNRDYSYHPVKPPNTFRVMVIGDSFTYGASMQIFDTFPKRLERYLNLNDKQQKIEVINYSQPGLATVQELRFVEHALKYLNPDLIVLQITLNDVEPIPYRVTHSYQSQSGQIALQNPIFHYWKSLGFVLTRVFNSLSHAEYKKYFNDIYNKPGNWERFDESLKLMAKKCEERGVKFGAVLFPLLSYPLDETYPFQNIHARIHGALKTHKIPFLDLFKSYQNIPPDRLQAIPGDNPHPNEIANRIAAESIYRWFKKGHFVPKEAFAKRSMNERIMGSPLSLDKDDDT